MDSKKLFCPFCETFNYRKYGARNGKQRFQCENGHIFLETSKTIFSSAKLSKNTLRQLIIHVIDDTKIETIMDALSISSRTAYMWRMKIYKVAGELAKETMLSNKVWLD